MSEPAPEPQAQPSATPPEPAPPAQPAQPQAQGEPPAPATEPAPAEPPEPDSVEKLPPWAQKLIRETRTEAAANRAKAKEHETSLTDLRTKSQAQLDGIAKALGLKPEEATPEQIAAERDAAKAKADQSDARARESAVELAVFRAAATMEVNGNALLDSRSFVSTVTGLDPAADDFSARVKDAIDSAVVSNPGWKLAAPAPSAPAPVTPAVPASSTGAIGAPPDGPRQWTDEDVARASPSQLQKAMDDGLLQTLGFGTARKARR